MPDWSALEGQYRAGVLSGRALARAHGISESALRKHAQAHGWTRDLLPSVQAHARAVLDPGPTQEQQTIDPAIAVAAATQIAIVERHREDIASARRCVRALFDALETDATMKLLQRTACAANLAGAMKHLIPLERQAYHLEAEPERAQPVNILIDLSHG